MKCVGNCAVCTLQVDKMACCLVQLLRNSIEIKKMLREDSPVYRDIPGFERIPIEEIGRKTIE